MSANLLTILVVVMAAFLASRLARAYLRFRGRRLIICPETLRPARVDVEATRAALTSLVERPVLRLHDCSRWPERAGCGQECLAQIEAAPEGCLVRTFLSGFYHGVSCAICGKPVGEIHAAELKPGFLTPDGQTVAWSDVRAEELPEVFATHKPVCASCELAESFRRKFPDRVVDREEGADKPRKTLLH